MGLEGLRVSSIERDVYLGCVCIWWDDELAEKLMAKTNKIFIWKFPEFITPVTKKQEEFLPEQTKSF